MFVFVYLSHYLNLSFSSNGSHSNNRDTQQHLKTNAEQDWLCYAPGTRRPYHDSSDCFVYPKNPYLNQATKTLLA